MPEFFSVRAHALNLRSAPKKDEKNRLALLAQGQRVEKIKEDTDPSWWLVKAWLQGKEVEGWVSAEYLDRVDDANEPVLVTPSLPAARFENHKLARLNSTNARHAHISEPHQPKRDASASSARRVAQLNEIIGFLSVETSARYLPNSQSTFCNIYATDYCYLAGCYVPRVWWKSRALADILAGQPTPKVEYDRTVSELNANSLYNWMCDYSASFGWTRVFSLDEIQNAANGGGVGITVARRIDLNRSGHITVVAPETETATAIRNNKGNVVQPLQSQAGAANFARKASQYWLKANTFSAFGFWIHP